MNHKLFQEVVVAVVFVGLVVFLLNPLNAWMPTKAAMAGAIGLLAVAAVFVGFIWREKGRDERENIHIMRAGRFAFIAGLTILTIGVVVQGIQRQVDVWLAIALAVMVLAKICGLIYGRAKN